MKIRAGQVWIYRSPFGPVRATVRRPSKDQRAALIVWKIPKGANEGDLQEETVPLSELLPTRGVAT